MININEYKNLPPSSKNLTDEERMQWYYRAKKLATQSSGSGPDSLDASAKLDQAIREFEKQHNIK